MKKRTTSTKSKKSSHDESSYYEHQPHHIEDELELELIEAEERARFRPYIVPDYVFVRPVRVCTAHLSRSSHSNRIDLPIDICKFTEDEQHRIISETIQRHYSRHGGVTALGEAIDCYRYFPTFDDFIFFSTTGELLGDSDGNEELDAPIATLPQRRTNKRS